MKLVLMLDIKVIGALAAIKFQVYGVFRFVGWVFLQTVMDARPLKDNAG